MQHFDVIAFDADDTLWHEIGKYHAAEAEYTRLLSRYHHPDWIKARFFETDVNNLQFFGYGVKGFMLSMIETAINVTKGQITSLEIKEIIELGRAILSSPIELLPHVRETLERLQTHYTLMIITKGDLFDQQVKIARSNLAELFTHIEIVSDKKSTDYLTIFRKYHIPPERFLMVGNSLRSDVMPVIEAGGNAAYIPYETTWAHENLHPVDKPTYKTLDHIGQLISSYGLKAENPKP